MKITCQHCGAKKQNHGGLCSSCMRFGTPPLDIPKVRLREMGAPDDLNAQDLIDFFSQPEDDDSRHSDPRIGGRKR